MKTTKQGMAVTYHVLPNKYAANNLNRSIVQEYNTIGIETVPGEILGHGSTELCVNIAERLKRRDMTVEDAKATLAAAASKWYFYVIPDILTWNSVAMKEISVEKKLIGRINYLANNGEVGESIEYEDAEQFENDIVTENFYGVPMVVVLYEDENGLVIPHDFLKELDPPVAWISEKGKSHRMKDRTEIEFYSTYDEAIARFKKLRMQAYNRETIIDPQNGFPYARLTFGVQRDQPAGASDLLHVRGGKNYLVGDFTRMPSMNSSAEITDILRCMQNDLGFDRIICHEEKDGTYSSYDIPFSEWQNEYFPALPEEKLLFLNKKAYLHIQLCDEGYDYTFYDAKTKSEMDGGILSDPDLSMASAIREICQCHCMPSTKAEDIPLAIAEELQQSDGKVHREKWCEAGSEVSCRPLDKATKKLDEYPMPDTSVSAELLKEYPLDDTYLPLMSDAAFECMEQKMTVYVVSKDAAPVPAFCGADISDHGGLFAISREEWEASYSFHEMILERLDRQQERESLFREYPDDCYAIYQVSDDDPQRIRFMNMDWIKKHNFRICRCDYDLVYMAPLKMGEDNISTTLEQLYTTFNYSQPADYHSRSMSVSDVVAIKRNGKISYNFVDSCGFSCVPNFFKI